MVDALILARAQFGLNIAFHILFPTITIALGWVLVGLRLRISLGGPAWLEQAYLFWVKVFALCFALGVVSGITMSFQFGTNWPGFMLTVGNIAGPLLAYEVLTAFFLEATFLGVMLFGRDRVPAWLHLLAAFAVAVGTTLSAFWILVLNSWMHTPAGFEMRDGVAHATDWLAIIFNPSMPYRLTHMLLASGLTVAFLIAGLSAYQLLLNRAHQAARGMLKLGVLLGATLIPLQIYVGDLHGLNTLKYQPAKIAAIEAIWKSGPGQPLVLFGVPDEEQRVTHLEVSVPKLASLILTHDPDGELKGLDAFEDAHPPVAVVFYAFRVMVGVGVAMLLLSWLGAFLIWRGVEFGRRLLWAYAAMSFAGWVATLAGWLVTEIGRQPYLVSGVLRTAEAAGSVSASAISVSLALYMTVYAGLLASFLVVLTQLARRSALSGVLDTAADGRAVEIQAGARA